MEVFIKKVVTGPIETNSYLVINNGKSVLIVDPSYGCEELISDVKQNHYIPDGIIITHGHFDHIMGIDEILKAFPGTAVYMHQKEQVMLRNADLNGSLMIGVRWEYKGAVQNLEEGDIRIGSFDLKVVAVPGHSPCGCAILFDKACLCGDILFAGSVGRSDLPGGNGQLLVQGIKEKLLPLPDDTVVYPGHGGRTTIGREKRLNPYLQ